MSPTYISWGSMLARGRAGAVAVCDAWKTQQGGGFAQFLSDMGERPPGTSIDRIDPMDGYHPGNCRWATPTQQSFNQVSIRDKVNRLSRAQLDGVADRLREAA